MHQFNKYVEMQDVSSAENLEEIILFSNAYICLFKDTKLLEIRVNKLEKKNSSILLFTLFLFVYINYNF